ncbi:MAG: hypothetical protein A2186_01230 [Candidatus Levybacteria bacterium RIFOXYA1_FULL_41_10]|nr:MAG: hypothetical protein UT44_C0011G0014 [Candidatus Levybacteria bacterium GW2011_GWA1_39_32]KKR51423.1 MAG: hypothetical protein UT87_C0006G0003 [Candidatus Levybacteria bacterium GW2011_GWC1_40_19]KKR94878.1 MAG: hypothetical protein UU45_C0006G0040 [Candidatus Levybacteria bacterium GW2011_GWA2_41_15]KKS02453.1 MAG: hypothetical protein UU52_C0001G0037 [Candidatus Levybacteria bacterium GW2011_GWB1_41_21]OGH27088.1 MAG: hypothetical protein A3D82_02550 [Candidatus Levybacteria bacterium
MQSQYKRRAKVGIIIWLIVSISNLYLGFSLLPQVLQTGNSNFSNPAFFLTGFVGYASLIIGLYYYAKSKGYSGWLGLLGFLQLIGILIIVLLKDKTNPNSAKKSNKLLIIFAAAILIIIVFGVVSSMLLSKIDPFKQITEATIVSCTDQCNTSGENSNRCILTCLEEKNIISKDSECSSKCEDSLNVSQCVVDCVLPEK